MGTHTGVMLSAAKHLGEPRARSFASLRMTCEGSKRTLREVYAERSECAQHDIWGKRGRQFTHMAEASGPLVLRTMRHFHSHHSTYELLYLNGSLIR